MFHCVYKNSHNDPFKIKKKITGENGHLKSYLSYKTANINGTNWLVYNIVCGQQSHSCKMANITLVGLHLQR